MNKEDYVSLEVAKLLKEKGFDEKCNHYWWRHDNETRLDSDNFRFTKEWLEVNNNCYDEVLLAPALYEAQKWLRDKHNIHVCVDCNVFGWYTTLFNAASGEPISQINGCKEYYEEALNTGILEALKLI